MPKTLEKDLEEVTLRHISMVCCPHRELMDDAWTLGQGYLLLA